MGTEENIEGDAAHLPAVGALEGHAVHPGFIEWHDSSSHSTESDSDEDGYQNSAAVWLVRALETPTRSLPFPGFCLRASPSLSGLSGR